MSKKTNLILQSRQIKIESLENDPFCSEFLSNLKATAEIDLLCLSGNSYSQAFFQELSVYLSKMNRITRIILSDIFTTRKEGILPSLRALNASLQNKQIVLFDISSNAICPDGCLELIDVFKTNKTLKYVILNHVALSEAGTVTISKAIQEGGLQLKCLRVVKNRIENEAGCLAQAIENMIELEELIIFQNSIKNTSMTSLLQVLAKCTTLKILDIGDNHISDEHAFMVAQVITNNPHLIKLKIDDCNISKIGSQIILKSLKNLTSKNLQEFSYNYNEFESVDQILKVFKDFKSLKVLNCKGSEGDAPTLSLEGVVIEYESDEDEEEEEPEDDIVDLKLEFGKDFNDGDLKDFNQSEKRNLKNMLDELKDLKF